jgi:glycosyltransferase involved in cell wall biosynthesis
MLIDPSLDPMNIVIVGPAYPFRGGIAHHTGLLSRALSKHHSVEIITFKRQYPRLLFPGKSQEEGGGELFRVVAEPLLDSINPFNWLRVASEIRRRRPDLLIIPYSIPFLAPCYGTLAALTGWRRPTRVLYLCHNIIPHERHIGDTLLTQWAFAFGDRFLVQSSEVRHDLLQLRPRARVALAYLPVYDLFGRGVNKRAARKRLGIRQSKVLLFFGYIRPYKGLRILLDALHLLQENRGMRNLLLLVVGEFYEDQKPYHEQVERLGLSECVRFVPRYVPQNDVGVYFGAADVAVLPYISATQSAIVQVAYNFDKPVIATDVGGLGEIVQEGRTGFIVRPNDPCAFGDAIRRFYTGRCEKPFSRNVHREKQKYSWEAMVEAIETLCR